MQIFPDILLKLRWHRALLSPQVSIPEGNLAFVFKIQLRLHHIVCNKIFICLHSHWLLSPHSKSLHICSTFSRLRHVAHEDTPTSIHHHSPSLVSQEVAALISFLTVRRDVCERSVTSRGCLYLYSWYSYTFSYLQWTPCQVPALTRWLARTAWVLCRVMFPLSFGHLEKDSLKPYTPSVYYYYYNTHTHKLLADINHLWQGQWQVTNLC